MTITTTHPIENDLRGQRYSFVPRNALYISQDLAAAWEQLQTDWEALPPDDYLPDGGSYRFRRYGRVYFLPATGELLPLPHADYFQSRDINQVTGGIIRKFAPLLPESFDNSFLQTLIRFNFRHYPIDDAAMQTQPWQVDIHQVRIVAEPGQAGEPTPEGIHRDGAEFVTVHLAELANATGGQVTIYDNDRQPLYDLTLQASMDTYLFLDPQVLHSVTPIQSADGARPGVRSILTFDYHFWPELERPDAE
ncbi:MAG: 2OG-Fe dioxygenase family protein [Chloroflexi bacterium]|nr:2OG-Fe dioxygenase family protein [Chloroflexota bacterium]